MENTEVEEVETLDESLEAPPKVKKPRSEAQIKAFELARQKRDANRQARIEQKAKEEEEAKKQLEQKIVQKAISIKKKQIKKQTVLDEISDDDTPMEEVQKVITQKRSGRPTPVTRASPALSKVERVVEKEYVYIAPPPPRFFFH